MSQQDEAEVLELASERNPDVIRELLPGVVRKAIDGLEGDKARGVLYLGNLMIEAYSALIGFWLSEIYESKAWQQWKYRDEPYGSFDEYCERELPSRSPRTYRELMQNWWWGRDQLGLSKREFLALSARLGWSKLRLCRVFCLSRDETLRIANVSQHSFTVAELKDYLQSNYGSRVITDGRAERKWRNVRASVPMDDWEIVDRAISDILEKREKAGGVVPESETQRMGVALVALASRYWATVEG